MLAVYRRTKESRVTVLAGQSLVKNFDLKFSMNTKLQ